MVVRMDRLTGRKLVTMWVRTSVIRLARNKVHWSDTVMVHSKETSMADY